MKNKYYLMFFLFFVVPVGYAGILVSPSYPDLKSLTLSGTVLPSDIGVSAHIWSGAGSQYFFMRYDFSDGSWAGGLSAEYRPTVTGGSCGSDFYEGTDFQAGIGSAPLLGPGMEKAAIAVNLQLAEVRRFNTSAVLNSDNKTVISATPVRVLSDGFTVFYCSAKLHMLDGTTKNSGVWIPVTNASAFSPVPVPGDKSVCTLNGQNLILTYNSIGLDVSGLTQHTDLIVSCTSGSVQNYQLKLTGINVTNGSLNFGNGVSAQVSLNGSLVLANGSGVQLNGLTNSTILVSATLIGTASGSGTTTANGILVLEAF